MLKAIFLKFRQHRNSKYKKASDSTEIESNQQRKKDSNSNDYSDKYIFYQQREGRIIESDFVEFGVTLNVLNDDSYLDGMLAKIVDGGHPFLRKNNEYYFREVSYGRGQVDYNEVKMIVRPSRLEDLNQWSTIVCNRKTDNRFVDLVAFDKITVFGRLKATSKGIAESEFILDDAFIEFSDSKANELFSDVKRYNYVFEKTGHNTVKLLRYLGNDTSVIIPSIVDNRTVVEISGQAFDNGGLIESITIPETVEKIDLGAFKRCHSIKRIKLSEGLLNKDKRCFKISGRDYSELKFEFFSDSLND